MSVKLYNIYIVMPTNFTSILMHSAWWALVLTVMGHSITSPDPTLGQTIPLNWRSCMPLSWPVRYIWGKHWRGKCLLFHCDNQALVQIWESGLSRSSSLMCLVSALFIAACNFHVLIAHMPRLNWQFYCRSINSCLQLQCFWTLASIADPLLTPILAHLILPHLILP